MILRSHLQHKHVRSSVRNPPSEVQTSLSTLNLIQSSSHCMDLKETADRNCTMLRDHWLHWTSEYSVYYIFQY